VVPEMGVGLMTIGDALYIAIRILRYAWKGPNGSLTIALCESRWVSGRTPYMAAIFRYDVFHRGQTIVLVLHPRMFGVCGAVLLVYRMPLLRVVLSRVVAGSRHIGTRTTQRREAYPVEIDRNV
jgi:hypothetical protein